VSGDGGLRGEVGFGQGPRSTSVGGQLSDTCASGTTVAPVMVTSASRAAWMAAKRPARAAGELTKMGYGIGRGGVCNGTGEGERVGERGT
jgi:hypothetical protein